MIKKYLKSTAYIITILFGATLSMVYHNSEASESNPYNNSNFEAGLSDNRSITEMDQPQQPYGNSNNSYLYYNYYPYAYYPFYPFFTVDPNRSVRMHSEHEEHTHK